MNRRAPFAVASSCAVTLSLLAPGPRSLAAATRTFRQSSAKDFEEGEIAGTTILPNGEIVPGLTTGRSSLDAAFVWCSAVSRDGATVYWGTGDDGQIFAQPTAPMPAAGSPSPSPAPPRPLAKLDAPWVTAMVTLEDGRLLAATTPGGGVVMVDPAVAARHAGGVRPFATLPATHVWALVRDDHAGITYAATGLPGKVFAIDARGRARELWDARDQHVVSLALEADGTLLAGTSGEALLYRVFRDGRAEVLQDFDAEEVRAIARAPSGLYVAVNDFEKAPPPASANVTATPGPTTPARGTKVAIIHTVGSPPSSAGALPRPGARKSKAGLYRIDPAGRIEQLFALPDGYLTGLLVNRDGSVWVASGSQGRVHRVLPDGTVSMIIDVPERQVLTLALARSRPWLGTGDAAATYVALPAAADGAAESAEEAGGHSAGANGTSRATYLSKVLDAEYLSAWGALHWQGSRVAFETRSGNSAKPDAGWHRWTAVEASDPASPEGSAHIASAPARYLQYRATLRGPTARLRGVTVYFLPQNQRARITELSAGDAPAASSPAAGTPTPGAASAISAKREGHSSVIKLRWKVDNPDGDELVFRLSLRALDGEAWRPLAGMGGTTGEPLTRTDWDWETESLPDGHYVVRVVASDERSQPAARALSFGFDSAPLLIDNRKPDIVGLAVRYPTISGRAEDRASAITEIDVAIDGGEWKMLAPVDGIADERQEPFVLTLPALPRGPHAVAIRALDSNGNLGSIQTEVRSP